MENLEIIVTDKARRALISELRHNKVKYKFGINMYHVIIEDSPKSRMAIRMVREKTGMNSLRKAEHDKKLKDLYSNYTDNKISLEEFKMKRAFLEGQYAQDI
jgi:MinD superfamily P-loop ATPase